MPVWRSWCRRPELGPITLINTLNNRKELKVGQNHSRKIVKKGYDLYSQLKGFLVYL
jgi:hypothetical protein